MSCLAGSLMTGKDGNMRGSSPQPSRRLRQLAVAHGRDLGDSPRHRGQACWMPTILTGWKVAQQDRCGVLRRNQYGYERIGLPAVCRCFQSNRSWCCSR